MGVSWIVQNSHTLALFKKEVERLFDKHNYVRFTWTFGSRTQKQNDAIHVFCADIANQCNEAGFEMQITSPVFTKPVEVEWNQESVKKHLWKPVQLSLYPSKSSTTQLATDEVSKVAETLQRFLSQRFNIDVRFGDEHSEGS